MGDRLIPEHSKHIKPILINARNPFNTKVSTYFYEQIHWPPEKRSQKYHLEIPQKSFAETIPLYLSTPCATVWDSSKIGDIAGNAINILAPNPHAVVALNETELMQLFQRGEHKTWLEDVYVLHQENLSQELYDFLILQGYSEDDAQMVFQVQKQNVSSPSRMDYSTNLGPELEPEYIPDTPIDYKSFWTPELRQQFYDLNWIYFELFPEYKSELSGIKLKL